MNPLMTAGIVLAVAFVAGALILLSAGLFLSAFYARVFRLVFAFWHRVGVVADRLHDDPRSR